MGRSFWILDNVTPLREVSATVASASAHLFQPRDAYRMRYSTGQGRVQGSSEPEYVPPGAMIDYNLAAAPGGDVTLEILDAQGGVIRSFTSAGAAQAPAAAAGPFGGRPGPVRLDKSAGMHRFTWDLAYPGPSGAGGGRGSAGPLAAPGRYQARLTVGSWTATKSFNVLIDPRIERDGVTLADLVEQLAFSLKVRDAVTDARQTLQRVRDAQKNAAAGSDRRRTLDAAEAQLATASANGIRYPQPMLVAQLEYLYGMVMQADQKVGRDGYIRYDELLKQLEAIKQQVGQVVEQRG